MKTGIRVWDPLIRIFHWSLAAAFIIGYLSGEEENALHVYAGYAVLGLLVFRVLWGFIGTRYARFSVFVRSPRTVVHYLKSLRTGQPEHYTGHNPAGGWMIIVMLLTLAVITVSGLKVYAIEEGLGPLAGPAPALTVIDTARADDDDHEHGEHGEHESTDEEHEAGEEFWEEIHEASSNFMLLLVFLHIAGVIVAGRLHGENLVRAMITGRKNVSPGD